MDRIEKALQTLQDDGIIDMVLYEDDRGNPVGLFDDISSVTISSSATASHNYQSSNNTISITRNIPAGCGPDVVNKVVQGLSVYTHTLAQARYQMAAEQLGAPVDTPSRALADFDDRPAPPKPPNSTITTADNQQVTVQKVGYAQKTYNQTVGLWWCEKLRYARPTDGGWQFGIYELMGAESMRNKIRFVKQSHFDALPETARQWLQEHIGADVFDRNIYLQWCYDGTPDPDNGLMPVLLAVNSKLAAAEVAQTVISHIQKTNVKDLLSSTDDSTQQEQAHA